MPLVGTFIDFEVTFEGFKKSVIIDALQANKLKRHA